MKFDFVVDQHKFLESIYKIRFQKAKKGSLRDRRWVKEVFEMFSHKMELPLGAGIQLIKKGNFEHAKVLYYNKAQKLDVTIIDSRGHHVVNPERQHFMELFEMENSDMIKRVEELFDFACSIRYGGDLDAERKEARKQFATENKKLAAKVTEGIKKDVKVIKKVKKQAAGLSA